MASVAVPSAFQASYPDVVPVATCLLDGLTLKQAIEVSRHLESLGEGLQPHYDETVEAYGAPTRAKKLSPRRMRDRIRSLGRVTSFLEGTSVKELDARGGTLHSAFRAVRKRPHEWPEGQERPPHLGPLPHPTFADVYRTACSFIADILGPAGVDRLLPEENASTSRKFVLVEAPVLDRMMAIARRDTYLLALVTVYMMTLLPWPAIAKLTWRDWHWPDKSDLGWWLVWHPDQRRHVPNPMLDGELAVEDHFIASQTPGDDELVFPPRRGNDYAQRLPQTFRALFNEAVDDVHKDAEAHRSRSHDKKE